MVRFAAGPRSESTRPAAAHGAVRTLAVGHIRRGRNRMIVVPEAATAPFPGPWEVRAVVLVS